MKFLSLVVVLGVIYWLGTARFIHFDGWFSWLVKRLQKVTSFAGAPVLPMVTALLLPMMLLVIVILLVKGFISPQYWEFIVGVPVLLYSLGRGNFMQQVKDYIAASIRGDNVVASKLIDELRGNAESDEKNNDVDTWQSLHTQALQVMSYRGFEHTFAVLFWFFIAGPVGALLYRLSALYREISLADSGDTRLVAKWLWLLEYPAVRLMGITWALVGNFDTCPLRNSLLDTESSSMTILNTCLRGALGAATECATPAQPQSEQVADENTEVKESEVLDEEAQDIIEDLTGAVITTHTEPAYSFALVKASLPLYSRALLFWVCAIAFATLFVA